MTGRAVTWVVGAGGLLGRQVVARLRAQGRDVLTTGIPWQDPDACADALKEGLAELTTRSDGGEWNIAWCAGAGVVATSAEQLQVEGETFFRFLHHLGDQHDAGARGAFFLASSAGGLYAGSPDRPPFTENSRPRPLAPYGELKLAMEQQLGAVSRATGMPALVGRIGNIYGPGQNVSKPQGLVSHLCKAHLTGQPMSVYVSLDTLRDYLLVTDCAAMVVAGLAGVRRVARAAEDPVVVKVMASGRGISIGAVIAESTRVFRHRPRIVLGSSPMASVQARDLRLRSVSWPALDGYARSTLAAGIARTAEDLGRQLYRTTTR
ncbi:NAD-dependent epimerase/dehydratase family protein [Kribbella italica]|uniref:UDP-glucose 4-epimerase n=1 Tax=Kribbella italica TaxID=1540520 RepID=A0A7W9JCV9_9ACTN|nr:NAD-dependent epimerase/dehydratase family protein [Kribbella italica]MBB5839826.1 UDP-glucose 4-epimerase [Kribbella italica]